MYTQELASKLANTERALSLEMDKTEALQQHVRQVNERSRASPLQTASNDHAAEEVPHLTATVVDSRWR